jgi:hypothetical protein
MLYALRPRILQVVPELTEETFNRIVSEEWPAEADEHNTYINFRVYWCQKADP